MFARLDAEFSGRRLQPGSADYVAVRRQIIDYVAAGNLSITGAFHGMAESATLRGVALGNQEIYFEDSVQARTFLLNLYQQHNGGKRVPPVLSDATRRVIFTSQDNKDDAYWRTVYASFTAAGATGGDGNIVVYGKNNLTLDLYAHEMGHNLAARVYGSIHPDQQSRYTAALQSGEVPVSEYARNSPSEDFAESVKSYVLDRANFAANHPQRYAVIDQIMRSGNE